MYTNGWMRFPGLRSVTAVGLRFIAGPCSAKVLPLYHLVCPSAPAASNLSGYPATTTEHHLYSREQKLLEA